MSTLSIVAKASSAENGGKRVTVMNFLQEKSNKECTLKEKELNLKERQLQLDEERFKLEKAERQAKMEQEREERATFMHLIKSLIPK